MDGVRRCGMDGLSRCDIWMVLVGVIRMESVGVIWVWPDAMFHVRGVWVLRTLTLVTLVNPGYATLPSVTSPGSVSMQTC